MFESYGQYWNDKAKSPEAALASVDSSGNEVVARATGGWTAGQVRAAVDLKADDRVLELGCGVGRIGLELLPHCRQWIGTDISDNMLRAARERLAGFDNFRLEPLQRSSLDMLDEASVDKAYTVAVLCHMDKEDLFLYLQDMHRILKDGGLAYLETWNLAHPIGWERWAYEVNFWSKSDQRQRKVVSRNQFCVPEEFALYARKAGFDIVAEYTGSPWIQLVVGKGLDAATLEAQKDRLGQVRDQVAYSDTFAYLFGEVAKVIFGRRQPGDLLAELHGMQGEEAELYTVFVEGMWDANPQLWGERRAG